MIIIFYARGLLFKIMSSVNLYLSKQKQLCKNEGLLQTLIEFNKTNHILKVVDFILLLIYSFTLKRIKNATSKIWN